MSGTSLYVSAARDTARVFPRPNCLLFKSDRHLKREDIWKLMEEIQFSLKKLEGIVELRESNVDVTCQIRENALELYGKLRNHEKIEYVKLYESDKVYVTLCWVPTPFPQELIQKRFKEDYGEILKIFHKKDRKGLLSGTRIMVMNSDVGLETDFLRSWSWSRFRT